jgi:hypothetical protein
MFKRLAVASLLAALLPLRAAALDTQDLLALVAMPLAVAAVSEMTDVPTSDLVDVITLMNDAAVPPAQFIEVVRYVPVALVTPVEGPTFVEFVRAREREGVRGTQLVMVIEDRFRLIGMPADLDVVAPRVVELERDQFVPQIVRTRVAEVKNKKAHPHGGPPGQLKKIAGVQTGAEIVHREAKHKERDRVVIVQPRGPGHGGGHDQGGGKGKAKGKGKG